MKTDGCLMSFNDIIEQLRVRGIEDWTGVFVSSQDADAHLKSNDLNEKLRDTWWEVAWSGRENNASPKCLYLADSLSDALRRRPCIHIASGLHPLGSAQDYIDLIDQMHEDEDDSEVYWLD